MKTKKKHSKKKDSNILGDGIEAIDGGIIEKGQKIMMGSSVDLGGSGMGKSKKGKKMDYGYY